MSILLSLFFFFFSSRRRHTRFDCDWSSDVCSSDLDVGGHGLAPFVVGDGEHAGIGHRGVFVEHGLHLGRIDVEASADEDRKSTRLNSSHSQISYAVFCLKKKKNTTLDDVGRQDTPLPARPRPEPPPASP